MKLENISDVKAFFVAVDQCKGQIELVSPEGDRINLKSSQYLSIANMCSIGYIKELELVVHEKEDMDRLIEFMLSGENLK